MTGAGEGGPTRFWSLEPHIEGQDGLDNQWDILEVTWEGGYLRGKELLATAQSHEAGCIMMAARDMLTSFQHMAMFYQVFRDGDEEPEAEDIERFERAFELGLEAVEAATGVSFKGDGR